MALTKTPIELSSTPSIVDGGNATAITIDSSEKVGIGNSSPANKLAVNGAISIEGAAAAGISEGLLIDWSTNLARFLTYDSSSGSEIAFFTQPNGGSTTERVRIKEDGGFVLTPAAGGHVIFNENSIDADFRVESDGSTHMLFVDGGNNRVGINTADPATTLEVGGVITIKGTTGSDGINFESNNQRIYHGGHRLLEGSTSTTGTIGLGESYTGDISIQPRIKAHRGIVFGSDTATANTLDDYEEGTWDPDWTTTGTDFDQSGTSNSTGYYTKIGNTVMVTFGCVLAGTVSGGTGNVNITGLPFTAERASYGTFAPGRITLTYDSYYTSIPEGTSNVNVVGIRSANTGVQLLASEVNGNGTPFFSSTIVYRTTA